MCVINFGQNLYDVLLFYSPFKESDSYMKF